MSALACRLRAILGLLPGSSTQPARTFHARWQVSSDSASASNPQLGHLGRHASAGLFLCSAFGKAAKTSCASVTTTVIVEQDGQRQRCCYGAERIAGH